jgi:hypothetical protein
MGNHFSQITKSESNKPSTNHTLDFSLLQMGRSSFQSTIVF